MRDDANTHLHRVRTDLADRSDRDPGVPILLMALDVLQFLWPAVRFHAVVLHFLHIVLDSWILLS